MLMLNAVVYTTKYLNVHVFTVLLGGNVNEKL